MAPSSSSSSSSSEAPEPELPPEETGDDLETRFLQKARQAIIEEADRLVQLMIQATPQCSKLFKLEQEIDQPEMVREHIINKMRDLGYEVHPRDGKLGTFTLHLEVNVPPDLYPKVLWADAKKNTALTGAYEMEEGKIVNEWPVWKKITNPQITLYTTPNGSWVFGDESGDTCWAASMSTHIINPFDKDTVKGWGMPHSVGHWQLYLNGSWVTDPTTTVTSISPELWLDVSNKNLRGSYKLSRQDTLDPVWNYESNPEISLISVGKGKYGWMVGETPTANTDSETSEGSTQTGWVASVMQDSRKMPESHTDWFLFKDGKWAPDPTIKISRQRYQGPSIMVYRLVQTNSQHVTTASATVQQEIEDRARSLVHDITEVINEGSEKGRTSYDDLVNFPEGDVYYNIHVLERAIILISDLGLDDLELHDHANGTAVRFTYQLHVETWGDSPSVLVENVKAELRRATPGSWLQLSYSIPIDVMAQHLQEAGIDEFFIGRDGLKANIRIRVPWDTRDLWDSTTEKMKLEAKRALDAKPIQSGVAEITSRRVSPPRYRRDPALMMSGSIPRHDYVFGPPLDSQSAVLPYPPIPQEDVFHPSVVGTVPLDFQRGIL
eukprot:TRINITY_DN16625_c0_g3_i1.p1 TRINITY_DN16625_c0_g3~~TRINITY_DN16625_c0_g3_i1.p1  ORF type:complete len:608 (+),score=83.21 TRINITY_DN16625_c0_g3_i1:299-2122(+)